VAEDQTLLQSQKNKVAGLVTAAGLAPSAFQWLTNASGSFVAVSRLEHKESGFYYEFAYFTNQYEGVQPMALYSPGEDSREVQHELGEWDEHAEHVVNWLINLRRELQAPDMWSAAETLGSISAEMDRNEPFSESERRDIATQLQMLGEQVRRTYQLTASQAAMLERRLTYLERATARLGRFDWRGLAISMALTIAWDLGFNPAQRRELFEIFTTALGNVLQLLPRLPS